MLTLIFCFSFFFTAECMCFVCVCKKIKPKGGVCSICPTCVIFQVFVRLYVFHIKKHRNIIRFLSLFWFCFRIDGLEHFLLLLMLLLSAVSVVLVGLIGLWFLLNIHSILVCIFYVRLLLFWFLF